MTCIAVRCPHCQRDQSGTCGKTARRTQRSLCQHILWSKGRVLRDACHRVCLPSGKHTMIARRLHASGVRETVRSLPISPTTVLRELKKQEAVLESVHTALLRTLDPEKVPVDLERAGEAARDAMGSCVGNPGNPRWLWHAMDHDPGAVVASVCGRRPDAVFLPLQALVEPCGLTPSSPDHWGASTRHLDPEAHTASKHHTQTIERTPLTLRMRIIRVVRQPICFAQITQMHDMVLGVLVNRYAFGRAVSMQLSPLVKHSPLVYAYKGTLSHLLPWVMAALRGPHSLEHRKHEGCRQPE